MPDKNKQVKDFLETIFNKRGGTNHFDRFEIQRIQSGKIEIHLDVLEVDKEKPTVVFMPGTNAYAMIYSEFLAGIADQGVNIVGFDPRGHGRSGGGRGSYTISELLCDFRAAIRYARDRFEGPIFIAGSSQGGICAFYLAAEGYPVAGAICHNIADLDKDESVCLTKFPAWTAKFKFMINFWARLFPEVPFFMNWYIRLAGEPIRDLGSSRDMLKAGGLLVPFIRLKGLASLGSEPLPVKVEGIQTPVMLIHGEEDIIFPKAYVEDIYNRLTCEKEYYLCEGAHHYVLFDEVEQLVSPVINWISKISKEPGNK